MTVRRLASLDDTRQLALELASQPARLAGQVIYLRGDLGMGKTTLVRFLLAALGYQGRVKSPTYGLLELYALGGTPALRVLHLDLYRLEDPEELEYLALRDLHDEHTLLMVEWPDKGRGMLPAADLEIGLSGDMTIRSAQLDLSNPQSPLASLALFYD